MVSPTGSLRSAATRRAEAGRDAARLEDDDLAGDEVEQGGRNAGGLASSGSGFKDEVRSALERGEDLG